MVKNLALPKERFVLYPRFLRDNLYQGQGLSTSDLRLGSASPSRHRVVVAHTSKGP